MEIKIKITIGDYELSLSPEEAKELYNTLKKMFDDKATSNIVYQPLSTGGNDEPNWEYRRLYDRITTGTPLPENVHWFTTSIGTKYDNIC